MIGSKKIKIFIDGGSRGNPGPAALAVVFMGEDAQILKEYSCYLGETTNNIAEYQALIFALKKAKSLFGRKSLKKISFQIFSDSELLVKQMQGRYRIKGSRIQKLFLEAWNLKIDFPNLQFNQISREENKLADSLVNQVLDSKRSLFLP